MREASLGAAPELPRILRGVPIDKLLEVRGHVGQLQIAAMLDFAGKVLRDSSEQQPC